QLVEDRPGQGQGVHRGRRGQAVRPEGGEGSVRPALLQGEHDERPEPLRRGRGLRPAEVTRGWLGALVAIALAAGLALRLARLDVRPMHHDEANQAVKFGALLGRREYAYDAHDHPGPTLYYVTLPFAWLRGQATLAALDEWTLRAVPAAFGAATILLLLLLPAVIGRTTVVAAALMIALSPAMVFYSRMYIQESMFACFTLAFAIAVGRATTERGWQWPMLAGIAAGLAAATKETAIIVLPASLAACVLAWWSLGATRSSVAPANTGW